ncbi:MAG: glycine cleavage T C-terminal barrel domain-containing protein, partial [Deltaproteobacteria bacterium]
GCSPAVFDLLPPLAHTLVPWAGVPADGPPVMVTRSPDFGIDGFECFVPTALAGPLQAALTAAGAVLASSDALEVLRIEAGRPALGIDMTDETLAQEARLDALDAISYTKGCYTGQEVVARVHFRGHVNRVLRGVRAAAVPEGDVRVFAGDADIGDVRSRALSPRLGPIALAMVRREVEPGTPVTLRSPSGSADATVVELPFPA